MVGVALRPLLERVRSEAEALSAGRHRISLSADGGMDLLGAETEIASAFANLATNAVRYTPAGGEIRIRWSALPQGAEFSVEDTGPGIDPEHLPRLTERFYRVDNARSRQLGDGGHTQQEVPARKPRQERAERGRRDDQGTQTSLQGPRTLGDT